MRWAPAADLEVRVPLARMHEALAWYARWFTRESAVEVQVAPAWDADEAPTTLQLEAQDGIEAATALSAAGARLRLVTESRTRFRLDVVDPFGTRWQISELCRDVERRRAALRALARENGLGLRRLNVPAPPGLEQDPGPGPTREAVTLRGNGLRPPPELGLPHFEEHDLTRTNGEPWYYWSFISPEGHRLRVMFSSCAAYGEISAAPRDPDVALRLLRWSPEGWQDARPERGAFRVMRQDDSGNVFHVCTLETRWDALQAVAQLEARGHKQFYWLDEDTSAR